MIEQYPQHLELFKKHLEEGWSTRVAAKKAGIKPKVFTLYRRNCPEFMELCLQYNKIVDFKRRFQGSFT